MYISQRDMHDGTVLDLCGRFEECDHDQFMAVIETLSTRGCGHVVINLSSLYFLDPAVIDLLHFTHEYLTTNGLEVNLVSPLSSVRNELMVAKVPEVIPTYSSVYDALHRKHLVAPKLSAALSA